MENQQDDCNKMLWLVFKIFLFYCYSMTGCVVDPQNKNPHTQHVFNVVACLLLFVSLSFIFLSVS